MFHHLYTEQAGQLVKVTDCAPFLNKDNAELEAASYDKPVILSSTYVDMPETIKVRQEVEAAIYDSAKLHPQCQVLWVLPVHAGLVAIPGYKPFDIGALAAYGRNEINHDYWRCFIRTMAGKAAECPLEVILF